MKIYNTLQIYSIAALAAFVKGSPDSVNNDKDNLSAAIPFPSQTSLRGGGGKGAHLQSRKLDLFDSFLDFFNGDCPDGNTGDDCSIACQCGGSNTCEAWHHVCRAPGREDDSCHATKPCGSGLTCEAGAQVCRAPGKHGNYCHLTRPCGSGYWCVDAISGYNHQICLPDCTNIGQTLKDTLEEEGYSGNLDTASFGYKWENGVVPFVADCRLENHETAVFAEAMRTLEEKTVVRFEKYDSSKHDNYIVVGDYKWLAAYSQLGRMKEPGAQILGLDSVWGVLGQGEGVVIHELMHTLGFTHTQMRPDRDDYVDVHFDKIKSDYRNNFEIVYTDVYDKVQRCREYEYKSLMHYDYDAASNNCCAGILDCDKTMSASSSDDEDKMGNRDGMTDQDIEEINAYYSGNGLCGPAPVKGYKVFETGGCVGLNELFEGTGFFNATSCAEKCNKDENCVSFEYNKGKGNNNSWCSLSTTCRKTSQTVNDPDDGNYWYLKKTHASPRN